MRYLKPLIPSFLFLLAPFSLATVDNSVVFESWEEYISQSTEHQESLQKTKPISPIAKSTVVGQTNDPSVPGSQIEAPPTTVEARSEDSFDEYLIHFGAGARWLVTVRTSDGAREDKVLSVFSFSVSPYGIVGEVGVNLALGKDSSFFLEPNLKFYFVKHEMISIYLEGDFVVYSGPSSTHFGGGAGIGVIGGFIKHLSIELRASTVVLNLNDADSASLLNTTPDLSSGNKTLILCPSLELRLMARF